MGAYHRIIVKLSGEVLGGNGNAFDREIAMKTARVLVQACAGAKTEVSVVIGAGNIWRGRQGEDMDAVAADQMGMLGTVINCLYMADAVRSAGGKARVLSAIDMPKVCETFTKQRALECMAQGEIVFFAGGSGNPFFTTDTAVVLRAIEIEADAILLAKNIDGVYTDDPRKNPDARLIKRISYEEAAEKQLKVMDITAFYLCAERQVPDVRVFALSEPENILKVIEGDPMGTVLYSAARAK